MNQFEIALPLPVEYGGKEFHHIPSTGHPFPGTPSYFESKRSQVPSQFWYGGFDRFRLNSGDIQCMHTESYAHSVRCSFFLFPGNPRNPWVALREKDRYNAIERFMKNHAPHDDLKAGLENELFLSTILRDAILAECAFSDRNHEWALQLIQEASGRLPDFVSGYHFDSHGNLAVIPEEFDTQPLARYIENINYYILDRIHSYTGLTHNIIPGALPSPLSIDGIINQLQTKEAYQDATEALQKKKEAGVDFLVAAEQYGISPWLTFLGEKLLLQIIPACCKIQLDTKGIEAVDIRDESMSLQALDPDPSDAKNRVLYVKDETMLPYLFGLVHSDEYVLQFGRPMQFGKDGTFLQKL